jgi:hypothetical protein
MFLLTVAEEAKRATPATASKGKFQISTEPIPTLPKHYGRHFVYHTPNNRKKATWTPRKVMGSGHNFK